MDVHNRPIPLERESATFGFHFPYWFMICTISIFVFPFLVFPLFYDGVIPYI